MKRTIIGFIALLLLTFAIAISQDEKQEEKGRLIFQSNKCQSCHSIEVLGIKKKPNQKPPDLSTVGSARDSAFVTAYLKKKETINGVKHIGSFKGSDEELAALAAWLKSLKGEKQEGK